MNPWDQRFASEDFVYGTAPSHWVAAHAHRIPQGGRVLCLGEGEGRNGVWLARQGFQVEAVDGSPVGLEKARQLAARHGVRLGTTVTDLAAYTPEAGAFDAVVLVFLHLPPELRRAVHARAAAALRPGGVVLLEAFTPRQLAFSSGGPKQADMLFAADTVRDDFPGVTWESLGEGEVVLDEGPLHQGRAAVLRGIGTRQDA